MAMQRVTIVGLMITDDASGPGPQPPLGFWGPGDPRPTFPIAGWNPGTGAWPPPPTTPGGPPLRILGAQRSAADAPDRGLAPGLGRMAAPADDAPGRRLATPDAADDGRRGAGTSDRPAPRAGRRLRRVLGTGLWVHARARVGRVGIEPPARADNPADNAARGDGASARGDDASARDAQKVNRSGSGPSSRGDGGPGTRARRARHDGARVCEHERGAAQSDRPQGRASGARAGDSARMDVCGGADRRAQGWIDLARGAWPPLGPGTGTAARSRS